MGDRASDVQTLRIRMGCNRPTAPFGALRLLPSNQIKNISKQTRRPLPALARCFRSQRPTGESWQIGATRCQTLRA